MAAPGLPASEVARLRRQARALTAAPGWRRLLRSDGIALVNASPSTVRGFLRHGAVLAAQLQALADRVIES